MDEDAGREVVRTGLRGDGGEAGLVLDVLPVVHREVPAREARVAVDRVRVVLDVPGEAFEVLDEWDLDDLTERPRTAPDRSRQLRLEFEPVRQGPTLRGRMVQHAPPVPVPAGHHRIGPAAGFRGFPAKDGGLEETLTAARVAAAGDAPITPSVVRRLIGGTGRPEPAGESAGSVERRARGRRDGGHPGRPAGAIDRRCESFE
ncbi:hypothetical protein [Kitasatospora phosalacinea]|uniref:hypothetical protein n=1 Tax=Kitasatospora phosalacinea TaxID=2065 RepID=UPI0012FF508A|nr:hypothetical protein [Kitasatospora phosalacinea]